MTTVEIVNLTRTPPRRISRRVLGIAGLIVVGLAIASPFVWQYSVRRLRASPRFQVRFARSLLRSDNPDERRRGAWFIAGTGSDAGAQLLLVPLLEERREADPDVREAYVYAMGQVGNPEHFPLVASIARTDRNGGVRATAWLAAARIDVAAFREVVDGLPPPEDAWDRLGLAQAWLGAGDCRAVGDLLRIAAEGEHDRRVVACRALHKGVRPVLNAVGRWPLAADPAEGDVWPRELVDEVARRCEWVDLQAVADDTHPHLKKAQRVRRDVARLHSARSHLVDLLFWDRE